MMYTLLYIADALASTRTQIYLAAEQRRRLDELGKREGRSPAELIREAVDRYLAEHDRGKGLKLRSSA